MILRLFVFILILIVNEVQCKTKKNKDINTENDHHPFNQNLPNCKLNNYPIITKQTTKKAMLCPMFRDEEGFLSEWIAYYQMHGRNYRLFYTFIFYFTVCLSVLCVCTFDAILLFCITFVLTFIHMTLFISILVYCTILH